MTSEDFSPERERMGLQPPSPLKKRVELAGATAPTNSKMFNYMVAVYQAMEEEAETENGRIVWNGHVADIRNRLQIPEGSFGAVTKRLVAQGSIKKTARGTASTFSQYILVQFPEYASLDISYQDDINSSRHKAGSRAAISDMSKRLSLMERDIEIVVETVKDLISKVDTLTEKISPEISTIYDDAVWEDED